MAFVFPLVVGAAGAAGGFVVGYMYQPTAENEFVPELEKKIDKIKDLAPRKDINNALIAFDKTSLKKTKTREKVIIKEDELMAQIKKKLDKNRKHIKTEEKNKSDSSDEDW